MGTELFLIIVGIILRANGQWFHGAHEVGTISLFVGIGILAVELLLGVLALVFGVSAFRRVR